jgi:CHAT domain-containing protein
LSIRRAIGDTLGEAITLAAIGSLYASSGDPKKGLDYLNQSLALRNSTSTITRIGVAYNELNEKEKALEYFNQALSIWRAGGDRGSEAATLYNIAGIYYDRKEFNKGREQIEAAINIIESARNQFVSQDMRISYSALAQQYYKLYIDFLMHLHKANPADAYNALALQISERARARSLLESLNEARANIRQGVDLQLLEREVSLLQKLNAYAERQSRIMNRKDKTEEIAALQKEIANLTSEYQDVQTQIRRNSPRYAALTQPVPLTLNEIQRDLLDADTVLLEYSMGKENSYLWVVTKTSINSYELPEREKIETAARRVYELLSDGKQWTQSNNVNTQYAEEAGRLSEMLLAPVAEQLKDKRLVVVSDGALQYVPFGALPRPKTKDQSKDQFLVETNEIVSLPSASTLAVLRRETAKRPQAAKSIAVFADPVFAPTDERLASGKANQTKGGEKPITNLDNSRTFLERAFNRRGETNEPLVISRLPFTRREAEAILATVPSRSSLKAMDFKANRETVLNSDLSGYRIVHFATHGLLNSEHPELSGIVLSLVNENGQPIDGFLRLNEIYNLNLGADLVVLSACQTALGKEVKGEGLIGLTRGFMYAGSPRVIASLWKVDDAATAELMKLFYQKMLHEKMRPAAALRAAKVEMRKQKRWNAPFYWAAFELQGEWR